ncbi:MAG: type IX secretion system sortase PorU [Chitinophagales bacterium]|nr:type IX secretion system sortase PorU [Chitinophagales bacterium]
MLQKGVALFLFYIIAFTLLLPIYSSPLRAETFHLSWENMDVKSFSFDGAIYLPNHLYLPSYNIQKKGFFEINGSIKNVQIKTLSSSSFSEDELSLIREDWDIKVQYGKAQGQQYTTIEVFPFRQVNRQIEVLESFDIDFVSNNYRRDNDSPLLPHKNNSVLSNGDWYKIGVEENGLYKIDAGFLKKIGINVTDALFNQIKIYGHKGGMLPELAGAERTDDLTEIPIQIQGQGENRVIYTYLEGPEKWEYDSVNNFYNYTKNLYSTTKNYFITFNGNQGKRIGSATNIDEPADKDISNFDNRQHIEDDRVNLLNSGRVWLGQEFGGSNQLDFNFDFGSINPAIPTRVKIALAAGSANNSNAFQFLSNNNVLRTVSIPSVGTGTLANIANTNATQFTISQGQNPIQLTIRYNRPDFSSKAWLDYITMIANSPISYSQTPLYFRSAASIGWGSISQFHISNWEKTLQLWDVTNLFDIKEINVTNGTFKAKTDVLKEFVLFEKPMQEPVFIQKIENQNLHHLEQADYLIITRKKLMPYAEEIGRLHLEKESLSYHVVDMEQIFNEFSSGNSDLTAIRDFVKMFYDRSYTQTGTAPKYLLLFGSGNYDNRDLKDFYIPSYQSPQSFQETTTYGTDDYFGILDDDEGDNVINTTTNLLDISVGRITVDNIDKAQIAVKKIKNYYDQSSFGNWRTQVVYIADDGDNDIHIHDANQVADFTMDNYPNYNVSKIYLDAFKRQSVSGGQRYPDAKEAVNNKIFTGAFYMNFVGHGGPNGLTHEKVLTFDDINSWENSDKLFLFCTATCEFTRYDLPSAFSAGERVLLKENGGAIALVSTSRLVFSDKNKVTNENFNRELFAASGNNNTNTLGEIFLKAKNLTNTADNNRKFGLFGDPAIRLSFPKQEVVVTQVLAQNTPTDTIKSLSKVIIQGEVRKENTLDNNYSGLAFVSVYDKIENKKTLSNDVESPEFNFKTRESVLFKGRTEVKNGRFSISFMLPKDIDYEFGQGKISLYSSNNETDAIGSNFDIIIGGIADSIPNDKQGPDVQIFIDDESFVFGGMASKNSILLVKLEDESGINTSGTGLGHDIIAILNEDTKQPINLNEFYEGEIGDFTKGQVKYPFNNLENGRYRIQVKAWDVLNNSGEAYTEFIVDNQADLALYYVLNYPNPFTTNTQFSFEHNRPGDFLDIRIDIYTVSGKLVKTLQSHNIYDGRRVNDIYWDGLDEYGDKIGRGVYIYKVSVKDSQGDKAYKYQKLVLLR